jgi:hypothetical protein
MESGGTLWRSPPIIACIDEPAGACRFPTESPPGTIRLRCAIGHASRSGSRTRPLGRRPRCPRPSRCGPTWAERIAIRAIQRLKNLALTLLIAAGLGTSAGAPRSDRPEDSARRAHPIILDRAPDHSLLGLSGPESLFLPANRGSNPRNGQNEPLNGRAAQNLPDRPIGVAHRSDHSRGPSGPRVDPPSGARPFTEPPHGRAIEAPARPRRGQSSAARADALTSRNPGIRPGQVEIPARSGH